MCIYFSCLFEPYTVLYDDMLCKLSRNLAECLAAADARGATNATTDGYAAAAKADLAKAVVYHCSTCLLHGL